MSPTTGLHASKVKKQKQKQKHTLIVS